MHLPSDVHSSPTAESYWESLQETKPQVVRVMQMKKTRPRQVRKPKIHQCELCAEEGKTCKFNRRPDLARHISSVHKKNKPYKCIWPGCDKAFSHKGGLATHKNTHTGEKPWLCGECATPFGDQSSCARHQRELHTGLTHFCPYCQSTNKRASDFQNHLVASHNINKGSLDTAQYKLSVKVSLEDLEGLPQFNLPGMNGIAIRRSHPPPRARSAVTIPSKPMVVISGVEHEGTPFHEASQTSSSYQTTPSSTAYSLSPPPSFREFGDEGYSPQPSPYVHGNNALGMEFGTGGQGSYGNLHPISRTLSAASFLDDSRPPIINRPSSAPCFVTGFYTPDFSPVAGEVEQKPFSPHMTGGSSYMNDFRGQVYYPTAQTLHAPYAYHDQSMLDTENVQSGQQVYHYLPGGLGISHTIRSRAHLSAWGSQESFN
ncbi:hypothetical protein LXA43DRAFT_656525 [Ganoderma leucocontextum]|nr:hypothetical protein LXA43DRAFT_656525 [Ganoderma leucocontextum]